MCKSRKAFSVNINFLKYINQSEAWTSIQAIVESSLEV